MPRIRYIKPEFFTDENIAELPMAARLLFQGLWCLADKAGRLEDRPKYIKAMLFPYDDVDAEAMLALLDGGAKRFIRRYQADGKAFIQIINFEKHQKPHHTEKQSEIPNPPIEPESNRSLTVTPPLQDGKTPALMGMEKGMGKGSEASSAVAASDAPPATETPETTSTGASPEDFDTFWQAYPRKVGKAAAFGKWKSRKPPLTEVLKALEVQKRCEQWQDITLVPHPETWLNQKRWEDDASAYAPAKPKHDNHAYCEADALENVP